MSSGLFQRLHHPFNVPDPIIPFRDGKVFLFGRCAPRKTDRRENEETIVCQSDFVSRRHCEVYFKDNKFFIKDLKSLNGTFINGTRLQENVERELAFQDIIGLGISEDSADFTLHDIQLYLFVFKVRDVEIIEIDDDPEEPVPVERVPSPDLFILEDDEIKIVDDFSSHATAYPPSVTPSPNISPPAQPIALIATEQVHSTTSAVSAKPQSLPTPSPLLTKVEEEKPKKKPLPTPPPPPIIRQEPKSLPPPANPSKVDNNSLKTGPADEKNKPNLKPTSEISVPTKSNKRKADELFGIEDTPLESFSSAAGGATTSRTFGTIVTSTENRKSIESNSADDSSDGMSEYSNAKPKIEADNSPIKIEQPKTVMKRAKIKLRQLIRERGGVPFIRKSKLACLSKSNCSRIEAQWSASKRRCEQSISDSSNSLKPVNRPTKKAKVSSPNKPSYAETKTSKKAEKGEKPSKDEVKSTSSAKQSKDEGEGAKKAKKDSSSTKPTSEAKITKSSSSSKLSNGTDGKSAKNITCRGSTDSEEPEEPLHKRLKTTENNNEVLSSPEYGGYSQPYESPDRSISPTSDEEMKDVSNVIISNNIFSDVSESEEDFVDNRDDVDLDETEVIPHAISPKPTLSKKSSLPESKNQQAGPRQAILINNAPTPPGIRRGRAFDRFRAPALDQGTSPVALTKPNEINKHKEIDGQQTLTLKEKLKSIAIKSNQEAETSRADVPKIKAPVKTKMSRNRTEDLLESLMMSEDSKEKSIDDVQKELSRPPKGIVPVISEMSNSSAAKVPKRDLRAPLPMPSPETQAKMPMQRLLNLNQPDKASMPPPPLLNVQSKPSLIKKGVAGALERQTKSDVFDYKHSSVLPKNLINKGTFEPSVFFEDEAYRRILKWRPAWFEEQKKQKKPPPVAEGLNIMRTLSEYVDFNSYLNTFFPLMLLEIWATIDKDKDKAEIGKQSNSQAKFAFSIDKQQKVQQCPLIAFDKSVPISRDKYYTVLDCHTTTSQHGEFFQRKDLAIITLGIMHHDNNGKTVTTTRDFFAMLMQDHNTSPIETSMVNNKLKEINPKAKHKCTFQVFIHTNETINLNYLGQMEKISYVSPKLREVRAMFSLKTSKLFDKIISPKPPNAIWNPHAVIPQHQLVQHVSKLNPIQKSAVAYIADRIKSNEPQLLLLHGPPGTGKTRTIVSLILQILLSQSQPNQHKRILVCTPSNTAIDEIMTRLEEAEKDLPRINSSGKSKMVMLRIGETEMSSMKKYSIDSYLRSNEKNASMYLCVKKNIDETKKERESKEAEIAALKKTNGSKTRIESLTRDLAEIQCKLEDYKISLSKLRTADQGQFSASSGQKRKVLEEANVICSTLNSCSQHLLTRTFGPKSGKSNPFTCCIVDEASQTTEPETLAPLLLQVDKLILVGDPNQLGATVSSQEAESKAFGQSLFSRLNHYYTQILEKPQSVIMLSQQYRMHPEILTWPNEYFYRGLLKTTCIGRSPDDTCPIKPYLFLNMSSQETSNHEGQISNEEEVKMVIGILKYIGDISEESPKNNNWSIGVITPYNTQKAAIANSIRRELTPALASSVEVNTVDSFQGREKDIIIISCVRTREIGFLKSSKRLNVALTRARHSLLIVGDANCLRKDSMWKSLIDNAKERKCLHDISRSDCNSPGFLKKKIFSTLSPGKPQTSDLDPRSRKKDRM